jgi:hypothetical protein
MVLSIAIVKPKSGAENKYTQTNAIQEASKLASKIVNGA